MRNLLKFSRIHAVGILMPGALLFISCDGPTTAVDTTKSEASTAHKLLTAADSAAFIAMGANSNLRSMSLSVPGSTSIQVAAGDSIEVTIVSTDCSGNPETVTVGGAISGVVASGYCGNLPGTTVVLGPAASAGTIFFTLTHQQYGTGQPGDITYSYPTYTVAMDDGYSSIDHDDAILSVRVIQANCPPTDDPFLNSKDVLKGFSDAMLNSRPWATPGYGLKKEIGGVIWQAPDGHYYTQEVVDPNATECSYDRAVTTIPISQGGPIPGSTPVGTYHTHPSSTNEVTYGCPGWAQTLSDGKKPAHADPDALTAGGGSPADWETTVDTYPLYAITKSGHIYKLTNAYRTPESKRATNPFKYELLTNPGCPTKFL